MFILGNWRFLILGSLAIIITVGATVFILGQKPVATKSCHDVVQTSPVDGSQGYRVWFGDTMMSFEHEGDPVCVPLGWKSVGALEEGVGYARFEKSYTGVLIRSDSFASLAVTPKGTSYEVTVVYPVALQKEYIPQYVSIITNAFSNIGELYADTAKVPRTHTVLITASLAGNTVSDGTRVYPDPNARFSVLVRTPNQSRSEELFIHAIGHLYNRYRDDLSAYVKTQEPFSAENWQEVESTWEEIAFTQSDSRRKGRVQYLHNVHTAVMTKNFVLIVEPPFNDSLAFEKIVPTALVKPGASFLNEQYGHYVLSPLVFVAIDGLLLKEKNKASVASLFKEIHDGTRENFRDALKNTLAASNFSIVQDWMNGKTRIPLELLYTAIESY